MTLTSHSIAFHNVAALEPQPSGGGWRLERFPQPLRNQLGFKHHSRGRFFAERAAGCELRFVCDSPFVRVTLSAQEADSFVVVYKGDYVHSRHRLPAGVTTSLFLEEPEFFSKVAPGVLSRHRFAPEVWRVLFHQDALAVFHGVESFGRELRPPLPEELPGRRWLAYGSSITFGGNAFHPSNTYTQQAALRLEADVFCKGLPGSCLCEPPVARFLADLGGWDFATLELGVNLAELATPEEFAFRAHELVETIHRANPGKPVFVLNIFPNRADFLLDCEAMAARNNPLFNRSVQDIVSGIGHPNVRFIDGRDVLPDLGGLCVDLVHPSDEGHVAMGERLAALIGKSLG